MSKPPQRLRILYLSQYFPPEVGATQTRAYEMARHLAAAGHHVTMLAEVPNHPAGVIPPEYRGKLWERKPLDGIDVVRLWVKTSPAKNFRTRMLFYLSYMVMAIIAGVIVSIGRGKRYDLVYATSPPLFVALAGAVIGILTGTRFVMEVRDLWPESAVALGELSSERAIKLAQKVADFCYRRARRLVVVTKGIEDRLLAEGISKRKLSLITNGANVDEFRPMPDEAARLKQELGLEERFVAIYAGIHGIAQGMETLAEVAEKLQDRPDIVLVTVGEGPRKATLRELVQERKIGNLMLLPEQPRERMAAYLSMAGCSLVPLRDDPLFAGALPSKMFEGLASGTPVVLSVRGEAAEVLREAGGGISVQPEDAGAIADAILWLRDHPDQARRMGEQGRAFVVERYSRQAQAQLLEQLLRRLAKRKQ